MRGGKLEKMLTALAIAILPLLSTAMQPIDDEVLSNFVARDGITLDIDIDAIFDLAIEDVDGLDGPSGKIAPNAGIIYVPGIALQGLVSVRIDHGVNVNNQDVLFARASIPPIRLENFRFYTHASGLGSAATNADYFADKDNPEATLQRMKDTASILDPYYAIAQFDSLEMNQFVLVVELGTDPNNLLRVIAADVFDVSIANLLFRDMHGGGAIFAETLRIEGVDLTGVRLVARDNGTLTIYSPELNSRVAVTNVSVTDRVGNIQSTLGNVMLMNLSAHGTSINVRPQ